MFSKLLLKDLLSMRREFISFILIAYFTALFVAAGTGAFRSAFSPTIDVPHAHQYIQITGLFDSGDGFSDMTSNVTLQDIGTELNADGFYRLLNWGPHDIEYQGHKHSLLMAFVDTALPQTLSQGRLKKGFSSLDANEVILAEHVYAEQFGSDPKIIGQSILVNNESYVVIDVMEAPLSLPGLTGGNSPGLYAPLHKADGFKKDEPGFLTATLSAFTFKSNTPIDVTKQQIQRIATRSFKTHHNWGPQFRHDVRLETFQEVTTRLGGDHAARLAAGLFFIALIIAANLTVLLTSIITKLSFYWATYMTLGVNPSTLTRHFALCTLACLLGMTALAALSLHLTLPMIRPWIADILPTADQVVVSLWTLWPVMLIFVVLSLYAGLMAWVHTQTSAILTVIREGEQYRQHITTNRFLTGGLVALITCFVPAITVISYNMLLLLPTVSAAPPFDPRELHSFSLSQTNPDASAEALPLEIQDAMRHLGITAYTLSTSPPLSAFGEMADVLNESREVLYQAVFIGVDPQFSEVFRWPALSLERDNYASSHHKKSPILLKDRVLRPGAELLDYQVKNLLTNNTILYPLLEGEPPSNGHLTVSFRGDAAARQLQDARLFKITEHIDYSEKILDTKKPVYIGFALLLFMFSFLSCVVVVGFKGYLALSSEQKRAEIHIFRECGAKPKQIFLLYYAQMVNAFLTASVIVAATSLGLSLTLPASVLRNNIPAGALALSLGLTLGLLAAMTIRQSTLMATTRIISRRV